MIYIYIIDKDFEDNKKMMERYDEEIKGLNAKKESLNKK